MEVFADGGLVAVTSLVFPTEPYDSIYVVQSGEGGTSPLIVEGRVEAIGGVWD